MNPSSKQLFQTQRARLTPNRKEALKQQLLAAITAPEASPTVTSWHRMSRVFLHGYIFAPLLIILFSFGAAFASADSTPGDILYPVKRQVENIRVLVSPSEEQKLNLQVNFAQKRLEEAERVRSTAPTPTPTALPQATPSSTPTPSTSEEQTQRKSSSPKEHRELRVEKEAVAAVQFLERTKSELEKRGKDDKAKEIEKALEDFRKRRSDILKENRKEAEDAHKEDSRDSSEDSHSEQRDERN